MGTIGVPSIPDFGGLRFFPKMLALSVLGAKKPLTMVPTAERKERRFPSNFSPICCALSDSRASYFSVAAAGALTTSALPTISISESPGIHSTAMHAREGDFPGVK